MIDKNNINTVEYGYDENNNKSSYTVTFNSGKKITCFMKKTPSSYEEAIQEWIQEGNIVIDNGGNS